MVYSSIWPYFSSSFVTEIYTLSFPNYYANIRNVNFDANMHMMSLMNSHNNLNFDLCIRQLKENVESRAYFSFRNPWGTYGMKYVFVKRWLGEYEIFRLPILYIDVYIYIIMWIYACKIMVIFGVLLILWMV